MARRTKSTIPRYKRRRPRSGSLIGRLVGWIIKLLLAFLIVSVLWVLAYRFVNPPITVTMFGDLIGWISLLAIVYRAFRAYGFASGAKRSAQRPKAAK